MADNLGYTQGVGSTVATEEVTTLNGGAVSAQHLQRIVPCIATAAATAVDVPGDATNGIDVDVTRVSGNVTVVQATAANLNATVTGSVSVSSLPALVAGTAYVGKVRLTDGTSDVPIDTVYNDAESATENHLNVGARVHLLNPAGAFDLKRHSVSAFKAATYTAAQTSTVLWTPAAGKALVITHLQIQSYGTTAGTCVVYFGTAAYARNTNLPLFDGEFAPSATIKTSVVIPFSTPVRSAVNDSIRVTTTGAQSVTVVAIGYEI